MQALILVGGEATRLRPLTCNMPKAMVPVLNTPFLEHYIRYLRSHNIDNVVLAQGRLPELMDNYFQDGSRFNTRLTYSLESWPMNTAGAIKNAERFLTDRFFAMNGDIFTDLDLTGMLKFHLEKKAQVTIALTPVEDPTAYGLIETDSHGRVTRFLEKPKKEEVTTNMINAGTYIMEHEVLDSIPPNTNYSVERQLFPDLLSRGIPVYAYASRSYWIDIGTPEKYFQVHADLLNGKYRGYEMDHSREIITGSNCRIDPSAEIQGRVVIGDDCVIERGARITGPAVIGPGNTIMEEANIRSSITWQNVTICSKVNVTDSLIANDCHLNEECSVENAIIGDHITVTAKTRLGPGSRIWP